MTKPDATATELHLCNNLRHLFFALADVLGRDARAQVIYLEDDAVLSAAIKARLEKITAHVSITFTTDTEQIALFANLPRGTPEVLRRNLRLNLTRATRWPLPLLHKKRFRVGYLYHPGLFTAKPVAGACEYVIMRESGLNNYVTLPVPTFKAILRNLIGLPAFQQIWGEERWIDAIEVMQPDHLPSAIRHKARPLAFADLIARLAPTQRDLLAGLFSPQKPVLEPQIRHALILTQPLEDVGLCTKRQKINIYTQIARTLHAQGYRIHVKHHPAEQSYVLPHTATLQLDAPIEVWSLFDLPRFDLAVALCSASLSEGNILFAERVVQLMPTETFHKEGVSIWYHALPAGLSILCDKPVNEVGPL